MEDSHIAELDLGDGNSLFAVFDGHGGPEVAKFVKFHFTKKSNFLKMAWENGNQIVITSLEIKTALMALTPTRGVLQAALKKWCKEVAKGVLLLMLLLLRPQLAMTENGRWGWLGIRTVFD